MLKDIYLNNARIPERYKQDYGLVPSKEDEKAFITLRDVKDNIKKFVGQGSNVLICSNNEVNVKSSWSKKLLKAYIDQVQSLSFTDNTPALFVNVNSFLNEKKLAISDPSLQDEINKIERSILTAKLVVFDDIADKTLSEYDMSAMYHWIDYRTSMLKSCIFTSNQLPSQLQKTLTGKVFSRIVNYSMIVQFTDGDHRSVNFDYSTSSSK